jgi:hypothetical protein
MTHNDLCLVAVRWLQRNNGAGGPGCHVAVSECRSGWSGEIPDAIGFRAAGFEDGSTVVECKTSRADFLADRKKAHRIAGGLGNWRYFMAPTGLLSADDLPHGWGLLEVNQRGHVKVVAGLASFYREGYEVVREQSQLWRHEADREREQFLLVKLLSRVGDAEKMNRNLRMAYAEQQRLAARVNELNDQIRAERLGRIVRGVA